MLPLSLHRCLLAGLPLIICCPTIASAQKVAKITLDRSIRDRGLSSRQVSLAFSVVLGRPTRRGADGVVVVSKEGVILTTGGEMGSSGDRDPDRAGGIQAFLDLRPGSARAEAVQEIYQNL